MRYQIQQETVTGHTAAVYGNAERSPVYALAAALNELALEGAGRPVARMQMEVPFPVPAEWIRSAQKEFCRACEEKTVKVDGIQVRRNPLIKMPCMAVTVLGVAERQQMDPETVSAGSEILLAGWTGMEGMLRMVQEDAAELGTRFSPMFLKQIREYEPELFLGDRIGPEELKMAGYVRQVTDGGILAGLWDLAGDLGAGIELDIKAFPVLQETIEVCEHYRVNPYQLASAGCVLLTAQDGKMLARRLEGRGIRCSVIGRVREDNDKVIYNGEELRYIDRPAPDEIWKILEIVKGESR